MGGILLQGKIPCIFSFARNISLAGWSGASLCARNSGRQTHPVTVVVFVVNRNNFGKFNMSTEFTIILVPPLVDTVSGSPDKVFKPPFPHKFKSDLIVIPDNPRDKQRAIKLGRASDMIAFTFAVPSATLKTVCDDIANEIFQAKPFPPGLTILVDGSKRDSVIDLSGITVRQLADEIYAAVQ